MVGLVARLQAAQNRDGVFDARFTDVDRLETPFEGRVFFDVFAVFIQGGCTDAAKLSACELWLEQLRRVAGPFGRSGSDDGMKFIDKENNLSFGVFDFADHRLEPLLEFTSELGACDQSTHIQSDHTSVLERLRHVTLDNSLG